MILPLDLNRLLAELDSVDVASAARNRLAGEVPGTREKIKNARLIDITLQLIEDAFFHSVSGRPDMIGLEAHQTTAFEFPRNYSHF
jgi:hypothetical protein